MKNLILFCFLLLGGFVFSQTKDSIISTEARAEYQGGDEQFKKDIMKKFRIRKVHGKGTFVTNVRFIVERDGMVSNIKAKGENESFNKEAMRAVSKMKPKWKAGMINGENVRCYFTVPLTANFSD
ncbi:energy transducer TonB [Epilithonimonas xixisoli]|nr:energy transducer TonB [Epilithonimonas xixisoli]